MSSSSSSKKADTGLGGNGGRLSANRSGTVHGLAGGGSVAEEEGATGGVSSVVVSAQVTGV